jgi:hypothetical protein
MSYNFQTNSAKDDMLCLDADLPGLGTRISPGWLLSKDSAG